MNKTDKQIKKILGGEIKDTFFKYLKSIEVKK